MARRREPSRRTTRRTRLLHLDRRHRRPGATDPGGDQPRRGCHRGQDGTGREAELLAEVERLKVRLAKKDEVIAAVTAEMVPLKKGSRPAVGSSTMISFGSPSSATATPKR
jgi:hypothetical protein